ncbi:MAG: sigma-70 family RNA polymerase sigma factor [Oscillospiraceae bacterium]|nr:sigma-70 family RNA polymerase sigma factor [Oscillospiraceae bacterium]
MAEHHLIPALAQQAAQGNAEAFQQLYHLTRQRAWFVAISITKNEHDAQDILQDSYIKAWEKICTLEKPEAFAGWLSQIVANQAKNYIARKRPDSFADYGDDNAMYWQEETDVDLLPSESYDQTEAKALVASLIAQLPEDQRLVLLMRYYDDMDVAQVAETLEVPEGTVKSRLHRARAKLADMLRQAQDNGIALYTAVPIPLLVQVLQGLGLENDPGDRLPAILGLTGAGAAAVAAGAGAAGAASAGSSAACAGAVAGATTTAAAGASVTGIVAACVAAAVVTGGLIVGGVAVYRQQAQDITYPYIPVVVTTAVDTTVPTTEAPETTTEPVEETTAAITTTSTTTTTTTANTTTQIETATTAQATTATTRGPIVLPDWFLNLGNPVTTTTATTTTTSATTTTATTTTTTTTAPTTTSTTTSTSTTTTAAIPTTEPNTTWTWWTTWISIPTLGTAE